MTRYLDDIVPARWRKRIYAILGLLALIAGAVQTALLSTGVQAPTWLSVTLTVLLYLTAGGNALSRGNTHQSPAELAGDVSRETLAKAPALDGSEVPPQGVSDLKINP